MYIMCVCLFSALNRRVGALQISIIIINNGCVTLSATTQNLRRSCFIRSTWNPATPQRCSSAGCSRRLLRTKVQLNFRRNGGAETNPPRQFERPSSTGPAVLAQAALAGSVWKSGKSVCNLAQIIQLIWKKHLKNPIQRAKRESPRAKCNYAEWQENLCQPRRTSARKEPPKYSHVHSFPRWSIEKAKESTIYHGFHKLTSSRRRWQETKGKNPAKLKS